MARVFCRKELPAGASPVGGAGAHTLPPALVAAAARRLGTLGLLAAGTMVVFGVAHWLLLSGSPLGATQSALWILGEGGAIAASLGTYFLTRQKGVDPNEIVDRGLVYEVFMGFLIASAYHAQPWASYELARGWTPYSGSPGGVAAADAGGRHRARRGVPSTKCFMPAICSTAPFRPRNTSAKPRIASRRIAFFNRVQCLRW